jgi:L-fucose isomerase
MQMLTLLSGKPSCLLDVRYVDAATGAYVMPNCGAAATWFAGQSSNPAENLRRVRIVPAIAKYAGGGAHLEFVFAPARMTFARLSRSAQGYGMLIMQGETETHAISEMQGANANWPHAFVRLPLPPHRLIDAMQSNHLHGVAGDCVAELELLCDMLDIAVTRLT